MQDFFGLARAPAVGDGRVPLVLHLLAPNQRPVQVTTDLPGFWIKHYPALRKQLMRRYPRHAWPEDPDAARRRVAVPRYRRGFFDPCTGCRGVGIARVSKRSGDGGSPWVT